MKQLLLLIGFLLTLNIASAQTKKDGTPDKRFKAQKEKKGKTKKDGTPDKRFKENK